MAKMACPIESLLYQFLIPDLINHRLDKIKEICKNYRLNAAYVFGYVLTDKFSDKSDIDWQLVWNILERDLNDLVRFPECVESLDG